jgi:hypothetical protein
MYHAANSLKRSSARVSRPFSDPVAVSGAIIFSAVFLADTFFFAPFLMALKVVLDTFRSDLNVFRGHVAPLSKNTWCDSPSRALPER